MLSTLKTYLTKRKNSSQLNLDKMEQDRLNLNIGTSKDINDKRMTRKSSIFYIRLTVAIIMAYMAVLEPHGIDFKYWSYLYVAIYMGTNLIISAISEDYFYNKKFYYLLVSFDSVMIAVGLFLTAQADSYFFLLYFLIIGIAAMNMNLVYLIINTLMFIIIYGWLLYITGHFQGEMVTLYTLRLPFVLIVSLLFGYIIECVVFDVNKNIKESEEKLRSLVESINSPVFMLDREGRFLSVNDNLISELGLPRNRILHRYFSEFYPKEESEVFKDNVWQVFVNERPREFVSYNSNQDKWSLNVLSPVKEFKTNKVKATSVVSQDITEKVRSEQALRQAYDDLKKTQDQLIQKNKMEAIGRLASGVAHQIRNPLEIILMGVEYLDDLLDDNKEQSKQVINKIKSAVYRANRTIDDVLRFSRNTEFSFESIYICSLVEEAIGFLKHKLVENNIHINTYYYDRDLCVQADKNTLQQVFINIMTNAIEAMQEDGCLTIRVLNYQVSENQGTNSENGREKETKPVSNWVVVEIEDNGPGMPESVASKIFEPFYTTKQNSQGTGLGLSLANLIIERHHGQIELDSKEDKGTKFIVKLLPA